MKGKPRKEQKKRVQAKGHWYQGRSSVYNCARNDHVHLFVCGYTPGKAPTSKAPASKAPASNVPLSRRGHDLVGQQAPELVAPQIALMAADLHLTPL